MRSVRHVGPTVTGVGALVVAVTISTSGPASRRHAVNAHRRAAAPVASLEGSRCASEPAGPAGRGYGFEMGAGSDPRDALIVDSGRECSTDIGGTNREYGAGIGLGRAQQGERVRDPGWARIGGTTVGTTRSGATRSEQG